MGKNPLNMAEENIEICFSEMTKKPCKNIQHWWRKFRNLLFSNAQPCLA